MKIRKKIGNLGKDKLQQIVEAFISDLEQGAVAVLEYLEDVENSEFLELELDDKEKILSFTRKDGSHYIYNLSSETIDALKDKLNDINDMVDNINESTGMTTFETIDDPEDRLHIGKDKDGKIYNYRKKDGTLVEPTGIETNSLRLTADGMNEFEQALKDDGYQPGGGGDWTERDNIELPEPKTYALINLLIDGLPINDSDVSVGFVEYYDKLGNYFKIGCEVSPQGQTSRYFARTGGKGNYTLDLPKDIKFGSWVPQDSFHLKGCAKDVTRGILATSYKWAYMLQQYLGSIPNRVLIDESEITTTHATGDRMNDWPNDARCLPDGFPCEVFVNGEYWGLYALQLKKHRKNYSIKKSDYTSLFIDADNLLDSDYQHGFWLDGPDSSPAGTTGITWWNYFDIKGPKDLVCMDGSAFDGDHPKELIDNTSPVYDSSNKKHKGSAQAKAIIRGFSTKYLEVKTLIDNNNIEGAKAKFNENFDYNACMLVYIFNCLINNGDSIKKNTLWGTWENGKIAPMLWDIDGTYGISWTGASSGAPSAALWEGRYATSNWPLAFLWALYSDEIKSKYAELREAGIISMDTWRTIIYGKWVNRIGEEAYNRDIAKWSETPSYRENYTNTEYWKQINVDGGAHTSDYNVWDENTSYEVDQVVAISMHPSTNLCGLYKAIAPSLGQCPVTELYDNFPQVGGYYDSPKRMEKWMEEEIRLCDIQNGYFAELVADFVAFRNTQSDYVIQCNNMNIDHQVSGEYQFIEGYLVRHEEEVEGHIVSTYTITGGNVTERDESKTYTNVQDAVEAASTQEVDVPSENLYYIQARAKDINYHKK